MLDEVIKHRKQCVPHFCGCQINDFIRVCQYLLEQMAFIYGYRKLFLCLCVTIAVIARNRNLLRLQIFFYIYIYDSFSMVGYKK